MTTDIIVIISMLLFSLLMIMLHHKATNPVCQYIADAFGVAAVIGIMCYIITSNDTVLPKGLLRIIVLIAAAFSMWIIKTKLLENR